MLALLFATRGNSVSKSFRVRTVSAVESDTRETVRKNSIVFDYVVTRGKNPTMCASYKRCCEYIGG